MKAALHQDAGAAHLLGLGDLLVDFFEVEDVALVGAGNIFSFFGKGAVEGAEGAVLGAEVGVVDVAIDDVGDHVLGVKAATDGVGLEPQPDEVRGVEVVEGLLAGQRHGSSLQGTVVSGQWSVVSGQSVQGSWRRGSRKKKVDRTGTSASLGFAEEEEAALLDGVAAGAGKVGGGGDSAEENEPVPEGAEGSFFRFVAHGSCSRVLLGCLCYWSCEDVSPARESCEIRTLVSGWNLS